MRYWEGEIIEVRRLSDIDYLVRIENVLTVDNWQGLLEGV